MISLSAWLQRRETDQVGPLVSAGPAVGCTTSRDITSVAVGAALRPKNLLSLEMIARLTADWFK